MMCPFDEHSVAASQRWGCLSCEADLSGKVRCQSWLDLIREGSATGQAALCQQGVALRMNDRFDRYDSRFVPIKLERREEVHVLDSCHIPAGKQAQCSFGERFDAHDSG